MTQPAPPPQDDGHDLEDVPADAAAQPAAVWVRDHAPPEDEAQRQALETVRSVSRLEESN